jgi:CubicO group peptidase (beta-lactamase class C family)
MPTSIKFFNLIVMIEYFKKVCIAIVIFTFSNTVYAQTDSVDVFVKAQMQKRKIPGLQLAIVKNGKIIKTANYGLANVQDSIPVNNNTVFTINSITKAFTGVAIMQLVEAEKLNLSSPVSVYLSDLPASWNAVTVQQLLSHTSGIPNIVDEEESILISPYGEAAAWKQILVMPVDFKPGEKFAYNQTNYLLLGHIIDTLSGMPFTEFITKEQLQKAGMTKTIRAGFGANKDVIPHSAGGYRYSKGKLINMFFSFPPSLQTAAGMSSTASEIADWIIALQNNQFLKEKSGMVSLWAPAILNNGKTGGFNSLLNGYAAGWPIVTRPEHPAAAAVGGGRSAVFVYPNDDLSIIVLTNLAGGSPEAFIDEIAGFYIPGMKESNGFGLSSSVKLIRTRVEKSGYKNAIEEVKKIRKANAGLELSEEEINSWGYKLMEQNRIADALEIFKLNVFLYPGSANAFDSLGEIYAELGDMTLAIKNYGHSLKLNPQNSNAEKQIEKLKSNK